MVKTRLYLSLFGTLISMLTWSQIPIVEDQRRLHAYIKPAQDSASKAYDFYNHVRKGKIIGYDADSLRIVYKVQAMKRRQQEVEYIRQNPSSYAALEYFSIHILNDITHNQDSIETIYSFFDTDVKSTPLGESIVQEFAKRKSLNLNREMPDFSFKTNLNENFSVASFRNKKYVLLCFWDSWCAPCIGSIPTLREIATKYKKGLQLIHVSIDADKGKWLTSLRKYPMPWLQTCDLEPFIVGTRVRSMYNINYIPQYFLIDRQGKLVYHNVLSEDTGDYKTLHAFLQSIVEEELDMDK